MAISLHFRLHLTLRAEAALRQGPTAAGGKAAPDTDHRSFCLALRLACRACGAQDLQFLARTHTIRNRNRPAKQVGNQRWLNLHSTNRGSTRQSVLCAVSASPECLMNRGELHRLRTGSPAHCSRPSGPAFFVEAKLACPRGCLKNFRPAL